MLSAGQHAYSSATMLNWHNKGGLQPLKQTNKKSASKYQLKLWQKNVEVSETCLRDPDCLISFVGSTKDSSSVPLPTAFIICFFIFHLSSNCSLCLKGSQLSLRTCSSHLPYP